MAGGRICLICHMEDNISNNHSVEKELRPYLEI